MDQFRVRFWTICQSASQQSEFCEIYFSAGIHETTGVALYGVTKDGVTKVALTSATGSTVLKYKSDSSKTLSCLAFVNSNNVAITGVTFEGCGQIVSALYVSETNRLYVYDCIFQHNNGRAVQFFNSTGIFIENSIFFNNSGQIYDATPINEVYGSVVNQSYGAIGIMYNNFQSVSRVHNPELYF